MTARLAIFISGSGSNMVALARACQTEGFATPALVLSDKPEAAGLEKARALGIEAIPFVRADFSSKTAFEAAIQSELEARGITHICLAGFMRVLSGTFCESWQGRMVNIHPSLLPKYKGLHTHERALQAGDAEHGCSVHLVTAELDDGPILGQAVVSIREGDTAEALATRVLAQEHILYPKTVARWLEGSGALPVLIDARDT